jgi:hypothetical protein
MGLKIYYCILLLALTGASVQAQHTSGKLIRVLIVDGFSNHDWKQTSNWRTVQPLHLFNAIDNFMLRRISG